MRSDGDSTCKLKFYYPTKKPVRNEQASDESL